MRQLEAEVGEARAAVTRAAQVGMDDAATEAAVQRRAAALREAQEAEDTLNTLRQRQTALQAQIAELEARRNSLAMDDAAATETANRRTAAEEALVAIRAQVDVEQATLETLRADVARLRSEQAALDETEGRLAKARNELSDIRRQIGAAGEERDGLRESIGALADELQNERQRLNALIRGLEAEIEGLRNQLPNGANESDGN